MSYKCHLLLMFLMRGMERPLINFNMKKVFSLSRKFVSIFLRKSKQQMIHWCKVDWEVNLSHSICRLMLNWGCFDPIDLKILFLVHKLICLVESLRFSTRMIIFWIIIVFAHNVLTHFCIIVHVLFFYWKMSVVFPENLKNCQNQGFF